MGKTSVITTIYRRIQFPDSIAGVWARLAGSQRLGTNEQASSKTLSLRSAHCPLRQLLSASSDKPRGDALQECPCPQEALGYFILGHDPLRQRYTNNIIADRGNPFQKWYRIPFRTSFWCGNGSLSNNSGANACLPSPFKRYTVPTLGRKRHFEDQTYRNITTTHVLCDTPLGSRTTAICR